MEPFIEAYKKLPPVTRTYLTACVLITLFTYLDLIRIYDIYFNWRLIFYEGQIWRLITSFCYFEVFTPKFLYNILTVVESFHMLEDGSFHGRRADFVYMFLFNAVFMVICASFRLQSFLGQAFTMSFLYVFIRRNSNVTIDFLNIISFNAIYILWGLLLYCHLLGIDCSDEMIGFTCGHLYYLLEDVVPHQRYGFRILKTPSIIKWIFDPVDFRDGDYLRAY